MLSCRTMETGIVHIECSIHHCLLQGQKLEIVADAVYSMVNRMQKMRRKRRKSFIFINHQVSIVTGKVAFQRVAFDRVKFHVISHQTLQSCSGTSISLMHHLNIEQLAKTPVISLIASHQKSLN